MTTSTKTLDYSQISVDKAAEMIEKGEMNYTQFQEWTKFTKENIQKK